MAKLIRWFKRQGSDGAFLPGAVLGVLTFDNKTGEVTQRHPRWHVDPMFAWYDAWVGVFVDRDKRRVYVFPLPCIGFRVYWG